MKRYAFISAAVILLITAHVAVSQRDFSKVEFETIHVAGPVYMLDSGAGGNIAVSAGDDGILMIDDQYAPLADKIRASIRKISDGEMKFLLNTHHHGDHTGGNVEFGSEATIVAHANVRQRLLDGSQPKTALPVITYQDAVTLYFNGDTIELNHLPKGHTDADSLVLFKDSNVVHMGDLFFAGRFPYVDLGSGGTVQGYIANVAKAIERLPADVKIIPGHGPLSTLADLKTFHSAMQQTSAYVREQMESGKSLADIQKAGLPSEWKSWGSGFITEERWIEAIYTSYQG